MRKSLLAALFFASLWGAKASAHEKRADPCGCHHQYGLRHCHEKKKTDHCEAPVKSAPQKPVKATPKSS